MSTRPAVDGLARVLFGLLVVASFAAFFVTQRLKHAPTVVQRVQAEPFFSPRSTTHHREEKVSFKIKRADQITVTVVAPNGDEIATLARDRRLAAYTQFRLVWDGYTSAHRPAPDGVYRLRVRLREQGRSVLLGRQFTLHATPPRPLITSVSPAILPSPTGTPATVRFTAAGRAPQLTVYRTDVSPPRPVTTLAVAAGASTAVWDGTAHGRKVGPGTYLVAIRAIDAEGNVGSTPAVLPPRPRSGEVIPGHAGITVRYLGIQPPSESTPAGGPLLVGVDARRGPYAWSLTRVGARRPRAHGAAAQPLLRLRAPGGVSGVYVLAVQSRAHVTQVPVAVQGPGLQRVLVVLPAITWLGRDAVDDDGDGLPNTLDAGVSVRTARIFAGSGLPGGFSDRLAPLLAFLDRSHLRYDLITDLELARHHGVVLRGHTGVVLAGDERWLTPNLQTDLRSFVRRGGKLASLGVESLRRRVVLAGVGLVNPAAPAATDIFGARIDPLGPLQGPVTNFLDKLGLFGGAGGQFSGYSSGEPTQSVGTGAQLVASAVTPDGRPVIIGVRYGHGIVLRTGLPELTGRLAADPAAQALIGRIWTLLSR
ncbi:MAG: hypothetical protein NVSMB51_20990 [Solirubrobacteraceae bacterium]